MAWSKISSSGLLNKNRNGPIRADPEEGHKSNQKNTYPLKDRESVGVVPPGEENTSGRPYYGLLICNGGLWQRDRQRNTFAKVCIGEGTMFFKL